MEISSLTRYARISPSKVYDIALLLRGKNVADAMAMIDLMPRKGAFLISKTLHSAVANAENNHDLKRDKLFVKSAEVMEGPVFKRFKAKAKGTAGRIKKRTSHFRIVLTDENQKLNNPERT